MRLGGRFGELHCTTLNFAETGAQEDLELTRRLTTEFDAINESSPVPVPACPYCGNKDNRILVLTRTAFPRFGCPVCSRNFSRRTGTVFGKTKRPNLDAMRQSIRYLSLPLSCVQVADEVGVLDATYIERWRDMFAALADELAQDGSLLSHIRLGVEPTPATPCPNCGRMGVARRSNAGIWTCAGCGRLFSMRRTVIERDGRLEIVDGQPVREMKT